MTLPKYGEANFKVGGVKEMGNQGGKVAEVNWMIGSRSPAPTAAKDALKAFLLVLGNAENRIILKVQALKGSIPGDEELNGGDHPRMSDKIEETGDVLLVADEVVSGVEALKKAPNATKELENIRKRSKIRKTTWRRQ